MYKKALQLCSRFALQPNLLGYCGRDSAPAKLYRCITKGETEGVMEELSKFIVLHPYLQTIGSALDKDPYSYEVIEAYWLGNDLMSQIKPEHYATLVQNLAKQGVPDFLIEEIKEKFPQEFIPIHLFNILHVGVGKATGSVPFNLESINNCMVRWGKIPNTNDERSDIKDDQDTSLIPSRYQMLTVDTVEIAREGQKYKLVQATREFRYYQNMIGQLREGDTVALHWGWIAKKIDTQEAEKLTYWTKRLLASMQA